jgi:hypothetical protein
MDCRNGWPARARRGSAGNLFEIGFFPLPIALIIP